MSKNFPKCNGIGPCVYIREIQSQNGQMKYKLVAGTKNQYRDLVPGVEFMSDVLAADYAKRVVGIKPVGVLHIGPLNGRR